MKEQTRGQTSKVINNLALKCIVIKLIEYVFLNIMIQRFCLLNKYKIKVCFCYVINVLFLAFLVTFVAERSHLDGWPFQKFVVHRQLVVCKIQECDKALPSF